MSLLFSQEDANLCQKKRRPQIPTEDIPDSDEIIIGTPEGDNMNVPF